jgi:acetylornithine deacetylase/succinyl-diaminopimelate desuccinylase-like protein
MSRSRKLVVLLLTVAATGAAILTVIRYRLQNEVQSQLYIPGQTAMTPELKLLQAYVRVDTTNPPGKETAGARFLAGILEQNGVHAEVIESAPGRGSVYARIKGKRPNEGLLLLSHIDVVPARPEGWTRPPFAGEVYINSLWGRGTLDMKGVAVCELEAFFDVARSGRVPERDVVFLATADEEEGGHRGVEWLLAHRPDVFDGIRYGLNEGGITETRQEKISYVGVEIGTKMAVTARLRARDQATMRRVRIELEPYMTPHDPDRITPEVRSYLHGIAPLRPVQGEWLNDVNTTIAQGKFWLLARGYHELMQNVMFLDGVRQDRRGATMIVRMFNLPDEDPDARLAWLQTRIAPFGATIEEVTNRMGPAPLSPLRTPLFALIARESRRTFGNVPVGSQILAASFNDSRYLRGRGVVVYGIWPFPVDFYQTQGIHSIDERVRLDWFMEGVAFMRRIVSAWAFETQPGR